MKAESLMKILGAAIQATQIEIDLGVHIVQVHNTIESHAQMRVIDVLIIIIGPVSEYDVVPGHSHSSSCPMV